MLILGLNAHHGDSAACLVRDGRLIAAAEEERFRRVKHWAGVPTEAVKYCLREGRVELQDIDHIALNRNPSVNRLRRVLFVIGHRPDWRLVWSRLRNISAAVSISRDLSQALGRESARARMHFVEHHLAHIASAYLVSDFNEAVCVSLDGFGDFASAAWGMGRGGEMRIDGRIYFPHSLGIFYTAISQHLGFPYFGDEYKVMGLSSYGKPRFLAQMREIVRVCADGTYRLNLKYFRHHKESVPYSWQNCAPEVGKLGTREFESLLGQPRRAGDPIEQVHRDLACSTQTIFEEAVFALLNALYRRYRCSNLALSGGCAMNSVANGKVRALTPFRRLYLPPAASDAGGAIGAAFVVWNQLAQTQAAGPVQYCPSKVSSATRLAKLFSLSPKKKRRSQINGHAPQQQPMQDILREDHDPRVIRRNGHPINDHSPHYVMSHAYVGPRFDHDHILGFLRGRADELASQDCSLESIHDPEVLCARAAHAIADGLVVGWFQGRMEWGPRALGNRSILCDPRRADMKDILNARIKRRESFRPFAPSILREHVGNWFEQDDDVPFMMQVFQVRRERRRLVPATTHVDGSGRLHTVNCETNPLYYRLISEFYALTGVPMVLNTSFNENEPVVCSPEEALECFLRTEMDILVIGQFYIQRQRPCAA